MPETLDYIHDKISIDIKGLPDFVEFDPYTRSLNFDLEQIGAEAQNYDLVIVLSDQMQAEREYELSF